MRICKPSIFFLFVVVVVLFSDLIPEVSAVDLGWTTTALKTPEENMASLSYGAHRPFYVGGYHYLFYTNWKYDKLCYASSPDKLTYTSTNIPVPSTVPSPGNYSTYNGFADWYDVSSNTAYLVHNEGLNGSYDYQRYLWLKRGTPAAGSISWSDNKLIEYNATFYHAEYVITKVGSDTLYVVFTRSPSGGQATTWYRYSDNNGDTWSSAQRLDDIPYNWAGLYTVLPFKNSTTAIAFCYKNTGTPTSYYHLLNEATMGPMISTGNIAGPVDAISNANLEIELIEHETFGGYPPYQLRHFTLFTNESWSSVNELADGMASENLRAFITRTSYGFRVYYTRLNATGGIPWLFYREYYTANRSFVPVYAYPPSNTTENMLFPLQATPSGYWDYYASVNYAQDLEGEFSPVYWVEYPDEAPWYDTLWVSDAPSPPSPSNFFIVDSDPISSVPFIINNVAQTTPYNTSTAATYLLSVENRILINSTVYYFQYWEIGGVNYYISAVTYYFPATENVTASIHFVTSKPKLYPPPQEPRTTPSPHDFRTPVLILIALFIIWAICRSAGKEWLAAIPVSAVIALSLLGLVNLCTYTNYILVGLGVACAYLISTFFLSRRKPH